MTTLVNIARYHLVDRLTYLALPWGVMVFSFLVNLTVAAVVPPSPDGYFTGGLVTIYIFLLICGTLSMTRSLPFGLMLAFIAAQILAALGVVVVVSITHNWHAFGHFFATVTAPALTGVLAAIAVTMGLGGFTTLRRVTI